MNFSFNHLQPHSSLGVVANPESKNVRHELCGFANNSLYTKKVIILLYTTEAISNKNNLRAPR